MKILLIECLAFQDLYNKTKAKVIPIKLAYAFMKINEQNQNNCKFYQDEFNKILNLYCEKTEDGKLKMSDDNSSYMIIKDKISECEKAINELNSTEVDFNRVKLPATILDQLEQVGLTLSELEVIFKMTEVE